MIPASIDSEWAFSASYKLHVFVPDRALRARIDELGGLGAKAEVPDVFAREDPAFSYLLRSIHSELIHCHGDTLLQDALHGAVQDALISRYVEGVPRAAIDRGVRGQKRPLQDQRIARVIDYVETHLGEALTVAELAAVATLSPSHFSRAFKATVGRTVWYHVQVRRCERARELLATTAMPIAEVARVCGFASQPHLTQVLGRRHGATPGEIRRSGVRSL